MKAADDPRAAQVLKIYQQMGSTIYLRTLDQYLQLLKPWRPDGEGFISFLDLHEFDQSSMSEEVKRLTGSGGGQYGAYFIK